MVRPGESVQLTATVDGVEGFRILLNWINVTEHGTLSITSPNSATWVAPETLGVDDVRLEVIQFVVTVLSRVVSVKESGIDTDTQISTETKTYSCHVRLLAISALANWAKNLLILLPGVLPMVN